MSDAGRQDFSALLHEGRRFEPSAHFVARATAKPDIYDHADSDSVGFWAEQARHLQWDAPWTSALEWDLPGT